MRTLNAWIGDENVGAFTEDPKADGSLMYRFAYSKVTEANIVSLTMVPVDGELSFESPVFPPPFDMILPEGDRRSRIEEARKILKTDSFSLLSYVGSNPVNRVRFLLPEQTPQESPISLPTPREIAGTVEGRKLFQTLLDAADLRQGVAGVQPKLLGMSAEEKVSSQLRQFRDSTHLLKASTTRYPFLAANEKVCLDVFSSAGISVPETTLSADGELLLVKRFDADESGTLVGFEEAAALMGETSATKYQRDYGTLIEIMCEFIAPDQQSVARASLVNCVLLNHLLGNGDAHLKNFGVLYRDAASVELAPAYDCVSTIPYIPNDIPALALSFDWYSKAWCAREKLEEFALKHGDLTRGKVAEMIEKSCEAVLAGGQRIKELGKNISGLRRLSEEIAALWVQRVDSFMQEKSVLRKSHGSK